MSLKVYSILVACALVIVGAAIFAEMLRNREKP